MDDTTAPVAAPQGNNEKLNLNNTIFAGQSVNVPIMWLDRKQHNKPKQW
jgi:hypothetical protein